MRITTIILDAPMDAWLCGCANMHAKHTERVLRVQCDVHCLWWCGVYGDMCYDDVLFMAMCCLWWCLVYGDTVFMMCVFYDVYIAGDGFWWLYGWCMWSRLAIRISQPSRTYNMSDELQQSHIREYVPCADHSVYTIGRHRDTFWNKLVSPLYKENCVGSVIMQHSHQ